MREEEKAANERGSLRYAPVLDQRRASVSHGWDRDMAGAHHPIRLHSTTGSTTSIPSGRMRNPGAH